MSTDVETSWIKQYEDRVHLEYQRMGSKLRNFVRTSYKMPGMDVTFPIINKGAAIQKNRHAEVVPMNLDHDSVTATLADWYAPEYIDKLDQIKTNIELMSPYAKSAAWALGRKTDEMILSALESASNTSDTDLTSVTAATLTNWKARLLNRDVPDDGRLAAAITPFLWAQMLTLEAFSNSQWVGPDSLPFKTRMEAKYWNGVTWFQFTGLGGTSTGKLNQMWHPDAIGHAIGADITSEVNYIPTRVSTLVNAYMSMGSVLIDGDGVEELEIDEAA